MDKAYENFAVLGVINPVSTSTASNTTVVDVSLFEKIVFLISVGSVTATGTVNFVVKGDTASGGSFSTTVTGKSITQLDSTDSNKQVIVEVDANALGTQGFRYVRGTLTAATAASVVSVVALGFGCTYGNANQHNLSTVDEIVA